MTDLNTHPALRSPSLSSQRRPPTASSHARRHEPSSDLIFNLIASITSIALPDISEEPLAAVPEPVSNGPAARSTYRSESRHRLRSQPTTARSSLGYRPSSSVRASIDERPEFDHADDDDAAEPPVVHTSRAQSLRSQQSKRDLESDSKAPSLRTFSLNTLSLASLRGKGQDRQITPVRTSWNQAPAQDAMPARTSSLAGTRVARNRSGSVRNVSPKRKEKESITLLVHNRAQSQASHHTEEEPLPQQSHVKAIFGPRDRVYLTDAGPSKSNQQSLRKPVRTGKEAGSSRTENDLTFVPERMSSLRQQANVSPTMLHTKSKRTSIRDSTSERGEDLVDQSDHRGRHDDTYNDDGDEEGFYSNSRIQEFVASKQGARQSRSRASTSSNKAFKVLGISPTGSVATVRGEATSTTLTRAHLADLDTVQYGGISQREVNAEASSPIASPKRIRLDASVDSSSSRTSMSERPAMNSAFHTRPPSVTQGSVKSRSESRLQRWSTPPDTTRVAERTTPRRSFQSPRKSDARRDSVNSTEESVKAMLANPRLSRKIWRPMEGRGVSFSEVGDPKGHVVFCCVGMGVTRYISAFHDELAASLGLRIITPDRPGIGGSEPYSEGSRSPISWPDDIQTICQELKIHKFSLVAHSAGAIYALATALRMPQNIHGKIFLLAPWIPPSQLSSRRLPFATSAPVGVLPRSQRFLRMLPPSFLKLSNSRYLNPPVEVPRPPRRSNSNRRAASEQPPRVSTSTRAESRQSNSVRPSVDFAPSRPSDVVSITSRAMSPDLGEPSPSLLDQHHRNSPAYNSYLSASIWAAATTNANPSVSLLVCLEREHSIGFRYADVAVPVVIHHGSEDTRVPIENARAVARDMKRAEFRVCKGEGHGLMGNAKVMAGVLGELAEAWRGRRG